MADAFARHLEQGHDPITFIALSKQMQSLMHDIQCELAEWDIHPDASCDASAYDALKEKQARLQEIEHERELDLEDELDRKFDQYLLLQSMRGQGLGETK